MVMQNPNPAPMESIVAQKTLPITIVVSTATTTNENHQKY